MKIVFLGYHEIGYVALEFLKHAGAEIRAVFTRQNGAGNELEVA